MSDAPEPAPLSEEDRTFLRAVADIPEDRTTWLVYADWLEDRGDLRAEFLRLVVARDKAAAGDPATEAIVARLTQLRAELDPRWLATFDPAPVHCANAQMGPCRQVWTDLMPTDAPDIRTCQQCRGPVFYGHTAEEAGLLDSCGQSVALSTRVPPEQNPFPLPPPDSDEFEFVLDLDDVDAYSPPGPPPLPVVAPAPASLTRPWWTFW